MAARPGRWVMVVLTALLVYPTIIAAEIYVWTDDAGIVHMTDRWANVPPSMRPRVAVRESSEPRQTEPPAADTSQGPSPPSKPPMLQHPPPQLAPDTSGAPPGDAVPLDVIEQPAPHRHPVKQRLRAGTFQPRPSDLPFPDNVQLDPVDPNFVRIGQSRVRKDTLTYPRISLEDESKLQARLRTLQQQPPSSRRPPQPRPPRP